MNICSKLLYKIMTKGCIGRSMEKMVVLMLLMMMPTWKLGNALSKQETFPAFKIKWQRSIGCWDGDEGRFIMQIKLQPFRSLVSPNRFVVVTKFLPGRNSTSFP